MLLNVYRKALNRETMVNVALCCLNEKLHNVPLLGRF